MVQQLVEQRFDLSFWKVRRLAHFLFLAATVLMYSILTMATASSLFLSHAGSNQLPLVYLLFGIVSIPFYILLSQVVDRYSRPQTFRIALVVAIATALGSRFLIALDTLPAYYAVYIGVVLQWDLHNNILLPNLLRDYFTVLEYKRYGPPLGVAQAVGTLIGGGLTGLLSRYISTPNILLILPLVYVLGIVQLVYLERSQRRLESNVGEQSENLVETLKSFPDLAKRYPIVSFLASSSFLLVIIYVIMEYEFLRVYGNTFSESQLTGLLGVMRVADSMLQMVTLYCFTRPLIQWLGVARMNLMYPLTTLASFVGLLLSPNLQAAVVMNLNADAFYKSINVPVHQLNYNAIPNELMGRVRSLSDGLFYSFGLILAGALLWVSQTFLSVDRVLWIGIGLTLVLVVLRYGMGDSYVRCLEIILRSDAIRLGDISERLTKLPPQSSTVLRELIESGDRHTRIKGLELAIAVGNPSQFIDVVQPLLLEGDSTTRQAAVRLFSAKPDAETIRYFTKLLEAEDPNMRSAALEVLIASEEPLAEEQLRPRLGDVSQEVRVLASVAAIQTGAIADPHIQALSERLWQSSLTDATGEAIVRVASCSDNPDLILPVKRVLANASPSVKREGLKALVELRRPSDEGLGDIAVAELNHPDPSVRSAAFELLGAVRSKGMLSHVAIGLGDSDPKVRLSAATALSAYGDRGLSLARDSLSSSNPDVVQAAIAAIGQVRTKRASDILFAYLTPDFQQVNRTRQWQQQIPTAEPSWQFLAIAIADYHERSIERVLYVLSCLGHASTVNTVKRLLYTSDRRELANAIETLASLSHRRFVLPLMPILEQLVSENRPGARGRATIPWMRAKGYKLLMEALESRDRWIKIGALMALAGIPTALMRDPDPLVKGVAKEIFLPLDRHPSPQDFFMNRLLLLRNVALFKDLSLDELLLIDQALEQEQVPAGETIFAEGDWGRHFYIIAEGNVRIVKNIDGEQRDLKYLSAGQHFGEIALFDDAPLWDGAIAINDCTLLKLEKSRFISLIAQDPHIVLEICRFLSQRLRETDNYRPSVTRQLDPVPTQPALPASVEVSSVHSENH